jgi:uncharacterized membrane protein (DUF106 family)
MITTEFIKQNPKLGILLVSLIVTIFTSLINKYTTNQKRMKEIKDNQKKLQEEVKKNKNDPKKMLELQKEMMSYSGEMMKHSFRPMILTLIPLLVLFSWLRKVFIGTSLESSWIWWYIISGIILSMVFKKILKIE